MRIENGAKTLTAYGTVDAGGGMEKKTLDQLSLLRASCRFFAHTGTIYDGPRQSSWTAEEPLPQPRGTDTQTIRIELMKTGTIVS